MIIIMLELTIIMYKLTHSLNQIEMELYHASLQLLLILLLVMMARKLLQGPGMSNSVILHHLLLTALANLGRPRTQSITSLVMCATFAQTAQLSTIRTSYKCE
jgi:hypothetical protein